jgi:hypothetical protein
MFTSCPNKLRISKDILYTIQGLPNKKKNRGFQGAQELSWQRAAFVCQGHVQEPFYPRNIRGFLGPQKLPSITGLFRGTGASLDNSLPGSQELS